MTVEICADCAEPFCLTCDDTAVECAQTDWHCGKCGPGDCGPCADAERDQYLADIAEDLRLNGDCE